MKKLLPLILALIGTGAGVGAGVFLRPPPPEQPVEVVEENTEEAEPASLEMPEETDEDSPAEREYVKMSNQFIIPLVEGGEVSALVVMGLSIEVELGFEDDVFRKEPKLRDSFLQVMFDHANVGGFRGDFTRHDNLEVLRSALRDVAIRDAGEEVTDVLILEIARQDY